MTERSLEDIMRLVGNLLQRAEGLEKDSPHEAALMRSHAERWMRQYRIDEENLIAQDQFSILPVLQEVDITQPGTDWSGSHFQMWYAAASHTGVRAHIEYRSSRGYVASVVGYEGDVRYAIFLFNAARLMFSSKLEPEVDPTESEADNIYRLRAAGITRQRIAQMIWGRQGQKEGEQVSKIYQQACRERGEDPAVVGRNVNAKTYRTAYAREFVDRFRSRLWEARNGADSDGGTIELHGRAERVEEAFFTRFPHLRPKPQEEVMEVKEEEKPKRKGRALKAWTVADEAHYQRMHNSPAAVRARAAGRAAADGVEISRVARTKRVEEGSAKPEPTTGRRGIEG